MSIIAKPRSIEDCFFKPRSFLAIFPRQHLLLLTSRADDIAMPNQRNPLFAFSFALSALSPNCMAETKRPVRFMVLDTVSMPLRKRRKHRRTIEANRWRHEAMARRA